ncbi:hypothetical protein J3E69DRAFT_369330 [Trichoderma sp. SZMC 28015]
MVWGWMDLAMFMLALPQMPLLAAAANAPFRRKGAGSGRSKQQLANEGRPPANIPGSGRKGLGAIRIRRACMLVLQKRVAKPAACSVQQVEMQAALCVSFSYAGCSFAYI